MRPGRHDLRERNRVAEHAGSRERVKRSVRGELRQHLRGTTRSGRRSRERDLGGLRASAARADVSANKVDRDLRLNEALINPVSLITHERQAANDRNQRAIGSKDPASRADGGGVDAINLSL